MKRTSNDIGQTVVVGTLLVFALIVGFTVFLQVSFFPLKNQQAEESSFENALTDFLQLDDSTQRSITYNQTTSKTVVTSVDYPTQIASPFNPDEQIIANNETNAVTLSNTNRTVPWRNSTNFLIYNPDYIEFTASPNITYEYGIVATEEQRTDGVKSTLRQSRQSVIQNQTINVLFINNDNQVLQTNDPQFLVTVDKPLESVFVTDDGTSSQINLTLKTRLSEETWNSLLEDEKTSNGGQVTSISFDSNPQPSEVTISLETGVTYRVQWVRVGVNAD